MTSFFCHVVIALMFVGTATRLNAQTVGVFNATGVQPGRDQFSQFPFEHIDTATGSVVLTFTDLVLPGDGGSELRFVRSYNSKNGRWTFGVAGLVTAISDDWDEQASRHRLNGSALTEVRRRP